MKFQLPTGKTINITIDQFLDMTDEQLQRMIASDRGSFENNPFKDAHLSGVDEEDEVIIEDEIDNVPIEDIPDSEKEKIKKEFE